MSTSGMGGAGGLARGAGYGMTPTMGGGARPMGYGNTPASPYARSTPVASPAGYSGIYNPLDPGIAKAGPSIMPASNWGAPTAAMMGATPSGGLLAPNVQAAMSSDPNAQAGLVGSVGQQGANQMNNAFQAGGTNYRPWLNSLVTQGISEPTPGAMAQQWASEGLGSVGPDGKWQWAPGKGWDSAATSVY